MRVAIYTCVSPIHDTFHAEQRLYQQEKLCRKYMQEREWPVRWLTVLKDEAYTHEGINRPGYAELLRMVREREIDVVLVPSLVRISKSYPVYIELIKLVKDHNVMLVSVVEGVIATEAQLTTGLLVNRHIEVLMGREPNES